MVRRVVAGVLLTMAACVFSQAPTHAQSSRPSAQRASPDTSRSVWVTGRVTGRFQEELRVLPFAMIEAVSGSFRHRALTDAAGRYLMALPAGDLTLSATHAGYEPLSLVVAVPDSGVVEVDLELRARPVRLTPLDVRADARARSQAPPGRESEVALSEVEMQVLEVGPGLGSSGIAEVLSALPGNDPSDATDVLFMRGSTTDMKLVLLDGVPVYTPFHVAGLLKSFEPTMLDQAELHVGGAPARYDGGLTHILELSTRTARRDAVHFSGALDLLSGSAATEVPLGERAGLIASARSLHDLGSGALDRDRPYGYRDGLLSVDFEPASGHRLRGTGFWNRESVALDLEPAPDDAYWSNSAGSLGYRGDLGGMGLDITAGLSRYRASLPVQPGPRPGQGPLAPALLATADTDRARVVGELSWGSAAAPIRAGLSFERIDAAFSARVLGGTMAADSRGRISAAGAFVDATRPLAPGLSLRAGLRVDHFSGRATLPAPRASIRWAVAPEALLSVAVGRYHQPTRTPDVVDVEQTLADVAEGELPAADLLPIATADHVVVSLDQILGESVRLGLQGFWKSFQGLPVASHGDVRSSGIDVRVARAAERGTFWLGYGLSWFWSESDLSGSSARFEGRHLLSAGLAGRIGGPVMGEARVAFGSGLPYTSVPIGYEADSAPGAQTVVSQTEATRNASPSSLASGLDDSFLRLDAELYTVLEPKWGSRSWRIRPYLRLLNALDRRDSLFYAFEPWRSDAVRPLVEMPVLPLLGVAVSF